jgi:hypothetical protein
MNDEQDYRLGLVEGADLFTALNQIPTYGRGSISASALPTGYMQTARGGIDLPEYGISGGYMAQRTQNLLPSPLPLMAQEPGANLVAQPYLQVDFNKIADIPIQYTRLFEGFDGKTPARNMFSAQLNDNLSANVTATDKGAVNVGASLIMNKSENTSLQAGFDYDVKPDKGEKKGFAAYLMYKGQF